MHADFVLPGIPLELRALELHPALPHSWWWWLVVGGLVLAAILLIVVGQLRRRAILRAPATVSATQVDELRDRALASIDQAVTDDALSWGERARRVGRAVREFVGTASDGDADYQTAEQLRVAALKDPRFAPVAELAAQVDTLAFGDPVEPETSAEDAVSRLAKQAREVVTSWR